MRGHYMLVNITLFQLFLRYFEINFVFLIFENNFILFSFLFTQCLTNLFFFLSFFGGCCIICQIDVFLQGCVKHLPSVELVQTWGGDPLLLRVCTCCLLLKCTNKFVFIYKIAIFPGGILIAFATIMSVTFGTYTKISPPCFVIFLV